MKNKSKMGCVRKKLLNSQKGSGTSVENLKNLTTCNTVSIETLTQHPFMKFRIVELKFPAIGNKDFKQRGQEHERRRLSKITFLVRSLFLYAGH